MTIQVVFSGQYIPHPLIKDESSEEEEKTLANKVPMTPKLSNSYKFE